MKIAIGCDPNAHQEKEDLIAFIEEKSLGEVRDFGSDDPIYAHVAIDVAESVASGEYDRGILLCGTGIGMCITANKFPGIRAAVGHDCFSAERSILSNNGNVLCFGARVIGPELAKKILREWITLEFQDGSSTPKVQAILDIERENMK